MEGNSFGTVLEITLNEAQWNPGSGTLSTAMNLSDRACRARAKAYDPRVIGWEEGIRQRVELKAAGLQEHSCSVLVADTDDRVRYALTNGNQRHSAAVVYRVIHGSDTDYDSRFTGLLDAWEFKPGQVLLKLKTDERALWSNHPRWKYLRSEWFQMAPDYDGEPAAIPYGKMDSTGLGLDHGMVPTVPVYLVSGSIGWYATNIGPASFIKDVFVDGTLQASSAYNKVYGSLAGGKTFTIIEFVTIPADDAVVTCNLYGYPATTPAVFTGTDVITNPVTQIRHFLVNFPVEQSRGYTPGAWDTTASIIDGTSWDTCATFATARGLEGSRLLTDQQSGGQRFTEWLESFPNFRAFWNTEGKIELRVLSTQWPGYWDGSSAVISREDCLDNSFSYELDASDITRRISCRYLRDYVENDYLRSLDVEDLSVAELSDTTVEMPWAPARLIE